MARRTRRRSRSSRRRRRQKGGAGVAQHAGDFHAAPKVEEGMHHEGGDPDAAKTEGMGHEKGGAEQKGGKRKRKGNATKKGKKKGKNKTRKRKLNPFFKLMLDAKKKGLASFKYNGKTYKGKKHKRLGMIYKKA